MKDSNNYFDVIIIGGSYAGLSAALALGRALRQVLLIDSGLPCNWQTPHSHNFITQDGAAPAAIAAKAKAQVLQYKTVTYMQDEAVSGKLIGNGFVITTGRGSAFECQKLLFATGVKDLMPELGGFSECWGISLIHCPYCHGYEVKNEKTGILANGADALHYAQLISNWTKDLTIFTNGSSLLTAEQTEKITRHHISIVEKEIAFLEHENGHLRHIVFKDNSRFALAVLYSRPAMQQHCHIPEMLGCELTEQGLIKVDAFQKTTVANVFACGDNSNPMRAVAQAVAAGNLAGAVISNGISEEDFN